MVIMLNSFILSEDVTQKMKDKIAETLNKEEFQKWEYTLDNVLDKYFKIADIK